MSQAKENASEVDKERKQFSSDLSLHNEANFEYQEM